MRSWGAYTLIVLIFFILLSAAPPSWTELAEHFSSEVEAGLGTRIFLDLRDINVVDVLKFLAMEGNLNIVTSKNVQGRSTLLLKDVTIKDTLDIILISNQLAYDIRNEIIYIMTEDEYRQIYGESYNDKRRLLTRSLKYAKPSSVMTALQSVQSAIGKVIIDEEVGQVILIDTPDKLAEMNALIDELERKVSTEVVQIQYGEADALESQLRSRLDAKAVGSVTADTRSNQLVVSAYPDRLSEVMPIIRSLDKKGRAVDIEVRILQITINPKFDYGIDWDKIFVTSRGTKHGRNARTLDLDGTFPIASAISSGSTFGKIAIAKSDADEFTADILALKQVSKTKVLANPRITVMDRQEAKINIGDRVPYVVSTTTGTGSNVTVSEEIVFIDVGIQLSVTPRIHQDGFVTMSIRPEISSQTGELETPQGAEIPIVNTTFVESSIIVKSGVTVILGGLRRDDLTENSKGIPVAMDIPVLGHMFKSRSESTNRSEIVIFLTPTIVTGGEPLRDEQIPIKPSRLAYDTMSPVFQQEEGKMTQEGI